MIRIETYERYVLQCKMKKTAEINFAVFYF